MRARICALYGDFSGRSDRRFWEHIVANPMAAAAAIDRVVYHSVILEFDVPSYRTDAAQQRSQAKGVNRQNKSANIVDAGHREKASGIAGRWLSPGARRRGKVGADARAVDLALASLPLLPVLRRRWDAVDVDVLRINDHLAGSHFHVCLARCRRVWARPSRSRCPGQRGHVLAHDVRRGPRQVLIVPGQLHQPLDHVLAPADNPDQVVIHLRRQIRVGRHVGEHHDAAHEDAALYFVPDHILDLERRFQGWVERVVHGHLAVIGVEPPGLALDRVAAGQDLQGEVAHIRQAGHKAQFGKFRGQLAVVQGDALLVAFGERGIARSPVLGSCEPPILLWV